MLFAQLEGLLAWSSGGESRAVQALALAWLGANLGIIALLALDRPLAGLHLAMSPGGALRARAACACLAAAAGAWLVLGPCLWIGGAPVAGASLLSEMGIPALHAAALGVLAQSLFRGPSARIATFLVLTAVLPSLWAGRVALVVSGRAGLLPGGEWAGLAAMLGVWLLGAAAVRWAPAAGAREPMELAGSQVRS